MTNKKPFITALCLIVPLIIFFGYNLDNKTGNTTEEQFSNLIQCLNNKRRFPPQVTLTDAEQHLAQLSECINNNFGTNLDSTHMLLLMLDLHDYEIMYGESPNIDWFLAKFLEYGGH